MKHDAHVRTAFKHFFPTTLIFALVILAFVFGFWFGLGYQFLVLH